MYDKCILVHCTKYEAAGWSLVLLLLSGVRADPKYSYSYTMVYDIIFMYVRIVTYDVSLKYEIFHFF